MRGNCRAQTQTQSPSTADPSVEGVECLRGKPLAPGEPENTWGGEGRDQSRRNWSKLIWDVVEALSQGQRSATLPYPRRLPASFTPEAGDPVRTATYALLLSSAPTTRSLALRGQLPSGDGEAPTAP